MCALVAAAALSTAAAKASPSSASTPRSVDASITVIAGASPWSRLPSGFRAAIDDSDARLVAIVAADIDADGDLDIVASDSTLQLHVWVNDGDGHLRRKRPARSTSLQPARPGPTIDPGRAMSPVPTQNDPRPLSPSVEIAGATLAPISCTAPAPVDCARPAPLAACTPRAPPASPAVGRPS